MRRFCKILVCFLLWADITSSYQVVPVKRWSNELKTGFQRRVAADPSFVSKSITEVLLAAGTQFTAEWNRRGVSRLLPEIDFIVPAILTAIFGYVSGISEIFLRIIFSSSHMVF